MTFAGIAEGNIELTLVSWWILTACSVIHCCECLTPSLDFIACDLENYMKACSDSLRQFLTDLIGSINCDWAV